MSKFAEPNILSRNATERSVLMLNPDLCFTLYMRGHVNVCIVSGEQEVMTNCKHTCVRRLFHSTTPSGMTSTALANSEFKARVNSDELGCLAAV